MFKETGQFRAKTADGRQTFTVIERAKVAIDIFDGKRQERLGTRDYCLDTGQDVSPISDDELFFCQTVRRFTGFVKDCRKFEDPLMHRQGKRIHRRTDHDRPLSAGSDDPLGGRQDAQPGKIKRMSGDFVHQP